MAAWRRSPAASVAAVLVGLLATPCLLFAGIGQPPPVARSAVAGRAVAVLDADEKTSAVEEASAVDGAAKDAEADAPVEPEEPEVDEKVRAFEEASIIDEAAKLAESDFPIKPEDLIRLAKTYLAYDQGTSKPEMLAEDFEFAGPVVGPLGKAQYLTAVGGFNFESAFPDFNPEFHHFRVDPFEPNRVWMTARGYGTNTEAGTSPLFKTATGKKFINPPQACSLRFNKDGLVNQYTIGYVMDRRIGNTGGLGGIYGILYALGKPLPFPEARPWKMSLRYKLFQKLGSFLQSLQKK